MTRRDGLLCAIAVCAMAATAWDLSSRSSAASLPAAQGAPGGRSQANIGAQIVDALNTRYGVHPGFRSNHAKGILVEGRFVPTSDAAALSTSPLFTGAPLPVTVRFSDAGGLPHVSDTATAARPHGMAIKFHLSNGAESDIVTNSLKVFNVATPEEFRDLQLAAATSPPGMPPSPQLRAFLDSHPSVEKANATLATPSSFATERYYGLDAFIFTNRDGGKQAVRYIVTPETVVHLSAEAAAQATPDFLIDELSSRLKQGPATFHLRAQLAAPGDQTKDPTEAWPEDRKVVDLGTLTLTAIVADSDAVQQKLLFTPGRLTVGIEPSDDPLIAARDAAYAESFRRRTTSPVSAHPEPSR